MDLSMTLGGLPIDKLQIQFRDLTTTQEREEHLRSLRKILYQKHFEKVLLFQEEPVFFVDRVPSRMNRYNAVKVRWQQGSLL